MVQPKDESRVTYGKMRTDKPAQPGYSAELVNIDVDPAHYDDLERIPILQNAKTNFIALLQGHALANGNNKFLGTRERHADGSYGNYTWQTYAEIWSLTQDLARGMLRLDLAPVSKEITEMGREWRFVGIWSKNRWEWNTAEFATMILKGTVVGFYDSMGYPQVDYCLQQTQMQTIFCSGPYLAKLLDMKEQGMAQHLRNIVLFEKQSDYEELKKRCSAQGVQVYSFEDILEAGRTGDTITLRPDLITKDDVLMLNYTSGTTGDPKGVQVTQWGLVMNILVLKDMISTAADDVLISYLPSPHAMDQILFGLMLESGGAVGYFQGDPLKLTEDCQRLQPTVFPSVPRLFNKIYGKIAGTLGAATGCKKFLIDQALSSKLYHLENGAHTTHGCWDKLVFNKVAAILGGRVRAMITGSAPISTDVLNFLKVCFRCPIHEGYGLSETQGATTATIASDPHAGHVGGPIQVCAIKLKDLPEMDYRLDDKPYPRGEVCVRGPCVFKGYFKNPEKTAEALDQDGFLHTGDVGMILPNGTLQILDRCKNIFKLAQGEYVAPEKCENLFIQSGYIDQCFVHGDPMKASTVAIVVANPEQAALWAAQNGTTPEEACQSQNADFVALIMGEMQRIGTEKKLNSIEKPRKIHVTLQPFTVESDVLTPTFKLKRNVAKKVYQAQIEELYKHLE